MPDLLEETLSDAPDDDRGVGLVQHRQECLAPLDELGQPGTIEPSDGRPQRHRVIQGSRTYGVLDLVRPACQPAQGTRDLRVVGEGAEGRSDRADRPGNAHIGEGVEGRYEVVERDVIHIVDDRPERRPSTVQVRTSIGEGAGQVVLLGHRKSVSPARDGRILRLAQVLDARRELADVAVAPCLLALGGRSLQFASASCTATRSPRAVEAGIGTARGPAS